jgi:hypothetical protein
MTRLIILEILALLLILFMGFLFAVLLYTT